MTELKLGNELLMQMNQFNDGVLSGAPSIDFDTAGTVTFTTNTSDGEETKIKLSNESTADDIPMMDIDKLEMSEKRKVEGKEEVIKVIKVVLGITVTCLVIASILFILHLRGIL